jgi:hypothetical protein
VITGHAVFMVDGEDIDAPAGTIVFVRDPGLIRAAQATADNTAILMVGGPVGVPYTVSRWEQALPLPRNRHRCQQRSPTLRSSHLSTSSMRRGRCHGCQRPHVG